MSYSFSAYLRCLGCRPGYCLVLLPSQLKLGFIALVFFLFITKFQRALRLNTTAISSFPIYASKYEQQMPLIFTRNKYEQVALIKSFKDIYTFNHISY